MGVGGQHHAPAALPPGKTPCPLYRKLGRPQGRSGRVQKISPPPGFDPRTVQPVASRYTDCAIPAEALYRTFIFTVAFVFPHELRWLHYNWRSWQNNYTFCQQLDLNRTNFAKWHVKRVAVIWKLLKILSFRDSNVKIFGTTPLTDSILGRTTVTRSISQHHWNLYDSLV